MQAISPDTHGLAVLLLTAVALFLFTRDVTEPGEDRDMLQNIPRLLNDAGEDIGPDWSVLDNVHGFPGERDPGCIVGFRCDVGTSTCISETIPRNVCQ